MFCRLRSSSKLGALVGLGLQPCGSSLKPTHSGVAIGALKANAETKETHNEITIKFFIMRAMKSKSTRVIEREGKATAEMAGTLPYE
jgi:hypothetical protein